MLLTEDIDRREDMAAIEGLAEARIGAIAFAPAMFGDRRETARIEAVEVVAGQDVDHTRDRIRAIDRRGAGLEHLDLPDHRRSEEHTSELQSLMRISYAVFCLKKKRQQDRHRSTQNENS